MKIDLCVLTSISLSVSSWLLKAKAKSQTEFKSLPNRTYVTKRYMYMCICNTLSHRNSCTRLQSEIVIFNTFYNSREMYHKSVLKNLSRTFVFLVGAVSGWYVRNNSLFTKLNLHHTVTVIERLTHTL